MRSVRPKTALHHGAPALLCVALACTGGGVDRPPPDRGDADPPAEDTAGPDGRVSRPPIDAAGPDARQEPRAPGPDDARPAPDATGASDGSSPAPDARPAPSDDAAPTAGLVPMFVAGGMGGRTVTSCDDGQSWIANHAYEAGNEEHSAYTHKGLAEGGGTFMMLLAWGANVSLKVSDDGVTWRRETAFDRTFYGGLGHGGGAFVMMRQGVTQLSKDAGKTWKRARIQPRADFREGGGGGGEADGVFAGGSGAQLSMSWDGGESWSELGGCPPMDFGGIGQHGGIAYGAGNLVFVSRDGATCRVTDGGKKVARGTLGATTPIDGKLFYTGGRFWVMNGNHAFVSEDGASWTRQMLGPVSIHAIARGASGTYVGVDRRGSGFYRSSDGTNWTKVNGPAGNMLLRIAFGYGKPSALCPAK